MRIIIRRKRDTRKVCVSYTLEFPLIINNLDCWCRRRDSNLRHPAIQGVGVDRLRRAVGTSRNVIVVRWACKSFGMWWPETGSNRRRRPFQGRALPLSYLALGI